MRGLVPMYILPDGSDDTDILRTCYRRIHIKKSVKPVVELLIAPEKTDQTLFKKSSLSFSFPRASAITAMHQSSYASSMVLGTASVTLSMGA